MIDRSAFLYMDPKGKASRFAQCETCMMWTGAKAKTCTIHGDKKIKAGDSCGLYVHGGPHEEAAGSEMKAVSPKESGLVRGEVRCENCIHFEAKDSECELFENLNEKMPEVFALDEKVHPQGCCNAFDSDAVRSRADGDKPKSISDLRKLADEED